VPAIACLAAEGVKDPLTGIYIGHLLYEAFLAEPTIDR